MARQREKETRRKKREETIAGYETYTYTGPSTAIVLFGQFYHVFDSFSTLSIDLSRRLNQDTIQGLWWGIVGMTDQWVSKKILESQYTSNVFKHSLHDHALR